MYFPLSEKGKAEKATGEGNNSQGRRKRPKETRSVTQRKNGGKWQRYQRESPVHGPNQISCYDNPDQILL